MITQGYNKSITTTVSAEEAFDKISRVSEWWAKDFEGKSEEPKECPSNNALAHKMM